MPSACEEATTAQIFPVPGIVCRVRFPFSSGWIDPAGKLTEAIGNKASTMRVPNM
jgi:hypothetical protein